jgi:hypothetical protein
MSVPAPPVSLVVRLKNTELVPEISTVPSVTPPTTISPAVAPLITAGAPPPTEAATAALMAVARA